MALADAAAGMNSAVQQILLQKLEAQRYADHQKQIAFENARQTASDERANRTFDYNTQRQEFLDRQNQTDKEVGFGNTLNESIPGETFLPGQSKAVGFLKTAGVPLTEAPARQAMGADFTGPMPGDATGPETPQQAQVGRLQGFIKGASQKQIDTNTDNARQAAKDAEKSTADAAAAKRADAALEEEKRYHTGLLNKPQAVSTVTIQTVDDQGKPVTRVVPKSEAIGQTYARPASAATLARVDSAEAVKQTGDDIIQKLTDPKLAAMVGPTMGRYNTLRDFIGDPPPEMAELAGEIESFALANMGVHGMRSVQGAKKITELLDRRHTPESLAAAIKGLGGFSTHFMENQGRTPKASNAGGTVSMVAPDGRPLMVPADKVAEMEAHGATRK